MAKKNRARWYCVDCSRNTHLEHYFVHNDLWFGSARMGKQGMLCVPCLEHRINRKLQPEDFTSAHVNNPRFYPMSDLLRSRILGVQ